MTSDFSDRRAVERYIVVEPLAGSFGAAAVTVIDIAEQGVQIMHAQPLRLGARGRLWFKHGAITVSSQALVIWSRLSKTPNEEGKFLYYSGLRLVYGLSLTEALRELSEQSVIRRDTESLERKRRREMKEMKVAQGEEATSDQTLLIHHARQRLLANPGELQKWYKRALQAADSSAPASAEALAVWEYLERSIPLATIARVFKSG